MDRACNRGTHRESARWVRESQGESGNTFARKKWRDSERAEIKARTLCKRSKECGTRHQSVRGGGGPPAPERRATAGKLRRPGTTDLRFQNEHRCRTRPGAALQGQYVRRRGAGGAQGHPVGADAVPFVDQEAARFEEGADLRAVPADDFFEDGDEQGERVVAEHGARGDVGDMLGFGDGDGEAVAGVDVEHYVDIGIAVAG